MLWDFWTTRSRSGFPSIDTKKTDKQFWQNINSVEFSGAGATNYGIARDDIDNW
jgi:hypothetical protein